MGAMAAISCLRRYAGATLGTTAVVTFNVVAFTVTEIPLVSYLAPRRPARSPGCGTVWLRGPVARRDAALLVAPEVA